jgi:hypothetical protein
VGGTEKFIVGWQSAVSYQTYSVAWGDVDGDGDLDIAAGNYGSEPNVVYVNTGGTLQFDPANGLGWQSADNNFTQSMAWGDYDADGDLDLAAASW